jgi:hypothetical protein
MNGMNQKISPETLAQIRLLDDFDLVMLISEINDHGWSVAQSILRVMGGESLTAGN